MLTRPHRCDFINLHPRARARSLLSLSLILSSPPIPPSLILVLSLIVRQHWSTVSVRERRECPGNQSHTRTYLQHMYDSAMHDLAMYGPYLQHPPPPFIHPWSSALPYVPLKRFIGNPFSPSPRHNDAVPSSVKATIYRRVTLLHPQNMPHAVLLGPLREHWPRAVCADRW